MKKSAEELQCIAKIIKSEMGGVCYLVFHGGYFDF